MGDWCHSSTMLHSCPADWFLLLTGFRMFAVGVGNAVEDELREIASEPVAEHYFYTADFRTISNIGKKLQMKICIGESGGLGGGEELVAAFGEQQGLEDWSKRTKMPPSDDCYKELFILRVSSLQITQKGHETSDIWEVAWTAATHKSQASCPHWKSPVFGQILGARFKTQGVFRKLEVQERLLALSLPYITMKCGNL